MPQEWPSENFKELILDPEDHDQKGYFITKVISTDGKSSDTLDRYYEYADDPDFSIADREHYGISFSHKAVIFERQDEKLEKFTIRIIPNNSNSDTIEIKDVDLRDFIPTPPKYVLENNDSYLEKVAVFCLQYNRLQVKFEIEKGDLVFKTNKLESEIVTRVDIAKNCLHQPLWELIAYKGNQPVYHAWFDFPRFLHRELIKSKGFKLDQVNEWTAKFSRYEDGYEPQSDTEGRNPIDLKSFRVINNSASANMVMMGSDEKYPNKEGSERWKKYDLTIYPPSTRKMMDFLTDSTCFAKFQGPGYYIKAFPWHTQLGRFKRPHKTATVREVSSTNTQQDGLTEIELKFTQYKKDDHSGDTVLTTRLIVGGIDVSKLNSIEPDEKGEWTQIEGAALHMPIGIANQPFIQPFSRFRETENCTEFSTSYSMILDDRDFWLNNHFIGVDGVTLHLDKNNPRRLHLWLLSFERCAFVSHFIIEHDWPK